MRAALPVAVVGGGIAGLAAAYRLQERGAAYVLFEAEGRLGGKILTERVDGFVLDGGPDAFLSERQQVLDLSEKVGLADRLLGTNDSRAGTYVFSGGRLHRLPEGLVMMVPTRLLPFLASPLVSWPGKLRMALDLVLPPRAGDRDESLASFVRRRLGREALEKIAEPLVAGIHAGDPETMSLRACFPRFLEMERRHGSLIRAMLAARRRPAASPRPGAAGPRRTYFMSYIGGMGELPAAVAARLDPRRLRTGCPVRRLEAVAGPDGRQTYRLFPAGEAPVEAAAVVLAVPAPAAAELLAPLAPAAADRLRQIPFTSTATVSLAYRRADFPHPLEGFGFVVPAVERRQVMGVTYTSIKWDHRSPDPEVILLRAVVGGPHNRELAEARPEEIVSAARAEVAAILGVTAPPLLARAYRWVGGWPQHTVGHLERLAAIEGELAALPGLQLAGASYRGHGIGLCIQSGYDAAEAALRACGRLAPSRGEDGDVAARPPA